MRVLVTGGAGFIGSSIASALLGRGDDVAVFDSLVSGHADAVPEGAELIKGDLRDPDDVRKAVAGCEVIFHEGALRSVPRSLDDPLPTSEANVTGTLNVLEAAAGAGCRRVIYASSSSVYGNNETLPTREDAAPMPLSPYAVSKLAAEHYCQVWSHLGRVPTISLRYFNVFGPGQRADSKYSAVFPAFVSALRKGIPPEIHGDGEQTRDFTFINDVVAANLAAASASLDCDGHVFNIATGEPHSVLQILSDLGHAMELDVEPVHLPERPGDVRHTYADTSKARQMFGWVPVTPWDEAIRSTVDWFEATV